MALMIMIIINMIASTSMSDVILKLLLSIANMDMIIMAAMVIASVMANLAKWFD